MKSLQDTLTADQQKELLPDGLIFLGYRGSIAHDMYVPKNDPNSIDDRDLMGIFVAPPEHYSGFGRSDIKEAFIGEWDVVSYEVRKFIGLLLKCNPNVLSLLWLPDKHILYEHPLGKLLRDNKKLFTSKVAYQSFTGYAMSQFKRMTHFTFQGYMGAKRKELVQKVGYDAKNAAHLIRLLRMGVEFLQDGNMQIARPDAQELLTIKRGDWPLENVQKEAERLFKEAEKAYASSRLPERPDTEAAEKLCMRIIQEYNAKPLGELRL